MKVFHRDILSTLLVVPSFILAQDSTESLNGQIVKLYQEGKVEEAIPLAEKVTALEKKAGKDSEGVAAALTNLAMLHTARYKALQQDLDNTTEKSKRSKLVGAWRKAAERAEELMVVAMKIYDKLELSDTVAAAAVKTEMASMLTDYEPFLASFVPTPKRGEDAHRYYREALATYDRAIGPDSEQSLDLVMKLAFLYVRASHFERGLNYYERYVSAVEKLRGKSDKSLVPALRGVMEIMLITDQKDSASKIAERIASITGQPEKTLVPQPILSSRASSLEPVEGFETPIFYSTLVFNFYPRNMFVPSHSTSVTFINTTVQRIGVKILVDERGNVVEANLTDPSNPKMKVVEDAAMKAKFHPFVYKGVPQKMSGVMVYTKISR